VLGWLRLFGPGVITGASDDDPSGIGTYSQAGAQFGVQLLWTLLLTYPLMAAIQEIAARIGRVTGQGLAANLRRTYPRGILYVLVAALVAANVANIAADIGAMGAAAQLVLGGPALAYSAALAAVSIALEVFIPYHRYARFLMASTVALLAYVATAAIVKVSWANVLRATLLPSLTFTADGTMMIVAILGTTISPYLLFWQASQEVEEERRDRKAKPLMHAPEQAAGQFFRLRVDTLVGMGASNAVAWFIMVTTAATLYPRGIHQVDTAAHAALALEPIAGHLASMLFAVGIVGTGLLAVPVLAGSASYAVTEAFHLRSGLERKPGSARAFYGILAAATLTGLALTRMPIDPMKALVYSAVVNGVVAVPTMGMMMLVGTNRKVMGRFTLPRVLRIFGWLATGAMAVATLAMFLAFGR
jgi:NRAMP (natural resistance-associated macrophage protein)-like metal ion transporter